MIVSACGSKSVRYAYGYEPQLDCVKACNESLRLNSIENAVIYPRLLSDCRGGLDFFINLKSPGSSGIYDDTGYKEKMISSTLDSENIPDSLPSIILIDVEGAEPLVIKGGMHYIRRVKPLIVFEFNDLSKKHFCISDIEELLGNDYEIFRLRGDGYLDTDLVNTWNCVAVNKYSGFAEAVDQQKLA
jgi:FkbM family methyltransferase